MNPKLITVTAKKVLGNKYIMIGIITLIVLFFLKGKIKRLIQNYNESQFDKNETTDVNQLAQQYRSASNPSGSSWMIDFDGTDEDAIEKLAFQTKDHFTDVASAYKQKFNETLTDRMRAELGSDEFQNWHNIIT